MKGKESFSDKQRLGEFAVFSLKININVAENQVVPVNNSNPPKYNTKHDNIDANNDDTMNYK